MASGAGVMERRQKEAGELGRYTGSGQWKVQGRRKKRRIMDKGQPRVERLDTDRVRVQSYNEGSRQHTNLPHEDKPFLSDAMTDICIFKYVANLINWVVSGIADDIADCFLIFKNNPIELPRACFAYLYPEDDHLSFNVETSMGMESSQRNS